MAVTRIYARKIDMIFYLCKCNLVIHLFMNVRGNFISQGGMDRELSADLLLHCDIVEATWDATQKPLQVQKPLPKVSLGVLILFAHTFNQSLYY